METIPPADLANAVTAFSTILSGLLPLILCWFTVPQPKRWLAVYAGIVVTGVATVWFHGYGETYLTGLADGGTNLLLAWLLQVAVLWDGYDRNISRGVAVGSGVLNLAMISFRAFAGPEYTRIYLVSFGSFGGFHPMELMLIADSFVVIGLIYGRLASLPPGSRPLLYLLTAVFFVGMLLATAANRRVDLQVIAYHALWHVVGAFGFLVLWIFNFVRFSGEKTEAVRV